MIHALCDACQNERGGYSTMRIATLIFAVAYVAVWVGCTVKGGQFIHFEWPDVSVISAIYLGKAAQSKFELGSAGLSQWEGKP